MSIQIFCHHACLRNRNKQCFELELSFAFENKKLNGNLWYVDDNTSMEFPKATRPKPVWQERLQFWLHGWNPAATDGKVWSGCNLLESFSPTLRALRRDVIRGIEIEKPQYDGICITERSSEHLEELIILPHNSFPQRRSWQVKFACCFKSFSFSFVFLLYTEFFKCLFFVCLLLWLMFCLVVSLLV